MDAALSNAFPSLDGLPDDREPAEHVTSNSVQRISVFVWAAVDWVPHAFRSAAVRPVLREQVDPVRGVGGQVLGESDMARLHRENEIGLANELRRERAGA